MATPTYVALGTITLATTDSEIVFSSIPATYRDLIIQTDGTSSANENISIQFNGDTGSNYSYVQMNGNGSTTGSSSGSEAFLRIGAVYTSRTINQLQLLDYSATDKHKTILSRCNAASVITQAIAGRWASTSAITSISIKLTGSASFQSGSTFSLYGVN